MVLPYGQSCSRHLLCSNAGIVRGTSRARLERGNISLGVAMLCSLHPLIDWCFWHTATAAVVYPFQSQWVPSALSHPQRQAMSSNSYGRYTPLTTRFQRVSPHERFPHHVSRRKLLRRGTSTPKTAGMFIYSLAMGVSISRHPQHAMSPPEKYFRASMHGICALCMYLHIDRSL